MDAILYVTLTTPGTVAIISCPSCSRVSKESRVGGGGARVHAVPAPDFNLETKIPLAVIGRECLARFFKKGIRFSYFFILWFIGTQ